MIELLPGCIPFEDAETFAVMFGVAASAIGIALRGVGHAAVHSFAVPHQRADLFVAIQAFQFRGARAEHVATGALQRIVQRAMGFGQRPRGDLSIETTSERQQDGAKSANSVDRKSQ